MEIKNYPMPDYNQPTKEPRYKLAHAYVPYQIMGKVYEPNEALCKGTIFPELYMPYEYEKRR